MHANARLTVHGRLLLCQRVDAGRPAAHVAAEMGISRATGGAGVGAVSAAAEVPLSAQLLGTVVVLPVAKARTVRLLIPHVRVLARSERGGGILAAWREPRTLLLGLLVLAFAFTEGSVNEWIVYVSVNGFGSSETIGAVALALFVSAMTVGQLLGGTVLARFGRVPVLRAAVGIAAVGLGRRYGSAEMGGSGPLSCGDAGCECRSVTPADDSDADKMWTAERSACC